MLRLYFFCCVLVLWIFGIGVDEGKERVGLWYVYSIFIIYLSYIYPIFIVYLWYVVVWVRYGLFVGLVER